MKPPICVVCDKDLKENSIFDEKTEKISGLLTFKKIESDYEFDRRVREENIIGHPPYVEWFCEDHYIEAKKLIHLPRKEAIKILSEKFNI